MAIFQALIAFLGRSAGRVLNALFGWAVIALFGRAPKGESAFLTGVVAAAAAWPLLLFGVAFPKVAALAIAFVPLSDRVPASIVRIVWSALALAVPLVVGFVVAKRAQPGTAQEPFVKRVLRGFPITLGIACAFLITFVTVPVLRVVSAVRRRKDEHIPYITAVGAYVESAARIDAIIRANDLGAQRAKPPWWLTAPAQIMKKLGGKAMHGFMPDELAYWKGPVLEVALHPSDIHISGAARSTAWTHGILAEALASGPGHQTYDAQAQDLEKQIQQVWGVFLEDPVAHAGSKALLARVDEIARDLHSLAIDYEEWQVVYRETVQLRTALRGDEQLLEHALAVTSEEDGATSEKSAKRSAVTMLVGAGLAAAFLRPLRTGRAGG